MWEKFDEMFPKGYVIIDGQKFTKEKLLNEGYETVSYPMIKPIRESTQEQTRYTWYADGSMEVYYDFNVFPLNPIDGISVLNAYGRKIYNEYMENSNR